MWTVAAARQAWTGRTGPAPAPPAPRPGPGRGPPRLRPLRLTQWHCQCPSCKLVPVPVPRLPQIPPRPPAQLQMPISRPLSPLMSKPALAMAAAGYA